MKRSVVSLSGCIIIVVLTGMSESFGREIMPTALLNGTLIDGTGAKPVQNAVIIIQQDLILAAGTTEQVSIPVNAQCLDLKGATILPGFINAHIHKGYDEQNLKAWAQSGVTTVRDLGAFTPDNGEWFIRRDALNKDPRNARLVAAGPFIRVPDGYPFIHWGILSIIVTSPEDAILQTESLLQNGADLIKLSLETGKFYKLAIPAPSHEIAAAIVKTAHDHGTVVSAHITSTQDVERAIHAGVDDIAHIPFDDLPSELAAKVVKAGIYLVPTLELWYGIYNDQIYQNAVSNLRRFVQAGGKVAMGTDYAAHSSHSNLGMPHREIKCIQAAGMTPMQIIVAATKNAAHVCNLEKTIGTIEPGKIADILIVKGNPLDDLRVLANVVMVIHNGVIIRQEKTGGKSDRDGGK